MGVIRAGYRIRATAFLVLGFHAGMLEPTSGKISRTPEDLNIGLDVTFDDEKHCPKQWAVLPVYLCCSCLSTWIGRWICFLRPFSTIDLHWGFCGANVAELETGTVCDWRESNRISNHTWRCLAMCLQANLEPEAIVFDLLHAVALSDHLRSCIGWTCAIYSRHCGWQDSLICMSPRSLEIDRWKPSTKISLNAQRKQHQAPQIAAIK
eukprot:2386547-Amphidinium_carterae.1